MHALARLVQQRRREDPTLTFARISELSGGAISASLAQHLGSNNKLVKFPEPRTIIGLAKALDVPESRVLLAAAEAVGIDVRDITSVSSLEGLQADMDSLPDEWQQHVASIIKFAVKQTKR